LRNALAVAHTSAGNIEEMNFFTLPLGCRQIPLPALRPTTVPILPLPISPGAIAATISSIHAPSLLIVRVPHAARSRSCCKIGRL
jgi:hypothetical protein